MLEPQLVPEKCNPVAVEQKMMGKVDQADWGQQIKTRASAEFDRVAKVLESAVGNQADQKRMNTLSVIAILEEKWADVMAKDHAGYFMHEWELSHDQVRQLIIQDPRYQAIKATRVAQ
jgi:hypothetical protein